MYDVTIQLADDVCLLIYKINDIGCQMPDNNFLLGLAL